MLSATASDGPFRFRETVSEVVRDARDGNRVRGIQSRSNKSFVLGGLFSVRINSNSRESPCGELWQTTGLEMEAMLYALDLINSDSTLLPGVEIGYDIRDTCQSETVGLDEAVDLIMTGRTESCEETAYAAVPTSGIQLGPQ